MSILNAEINKLESILLIQWKDNRLIIISSSAFVFNHSTFLLKNVQKFFMIPCDALCTCISNKYYNVVNIVNFGIIT